MSGHLDRSLEFLPTDKEMAQLDTAGLGLVSPQLAVLAAYVKITLTRQLEASTLPDEQWFTAGADALLPVLDRGQRSPTRCRRTR